MAKSYERVVERLNAISTVSRENEELVSDRNDSVVDLRFDHVCVAAIAPYRKYALRIEMTTLVADRLTTS
jgi:hypothetical protein